MKIVLYIIITILIIYSVIITILFTLKYNQKIIGGVHSDEINIQKTNIDDIKLSENDNPDNHFKNLFTLLCSNQTKKLFYNNNSKINYNDEICDDDFNNKLFSLFEFNNPSTFKPDFIIECKNKIIIIEADENNTFHSEYKNINYVKKRLYYDKLINTTIHNKPIIIFRFTYININNITNKNYNGILDYNITKILNYIILTAFATGCYILYKFDKKDKNIKILQLNSNDLTDENLNAIYKKNSNNITKLNTKIEYSADKKMIGKNINRLSKEYTDNIYSKYYFRDFIDFQIRYGIIDIPYISSDLYDFKNIFTENIFDEFGLEYILDYVDDSKGITNSKGFIENFPNFIKKYNNTKNDEEQFIILNLFTLIVTNSLIYNIYYDDKNNIFKQFEDDNYCDIFYNQDIQNFIKNNYDKLLPELKYLIENPFTDYLLKLYNIIDEYKNKEIHNIYFEYLTYYNDEDINKKYIKL